MEYIKSYSTKEVNSCGVYKIVNVHTQQFYIGSSKLLRQRKSQHQRQLRKNKHSNKYLQNAWNKYGEESFKFEIIWICDGQEQLEFEQRFIDLYKPVYNLNKKAVLISEEALEKTSKKLRKKYYLINPEGIQMCTDNLRGFCEDHNIARDNIAHLLVNGKSKRNYYQGWFITDKPEELKEENRYTKEKWYEDNVDKYRLAREEYITYFWKDSKLYVVGDINNKTHLTVHNFCEEFNLNKEAIRSAFNNKRHKG